jgi:hypothetical protein
LNKLKLITLGVSLLIVLALFLMTVGINNAGYRTVVQYPNGHLWVKFEPGWYLSLFGRTEQYPDVITFDYDKDDRNDSNLSQKGISVRYQDGGLGTIYGKDRFSLPTDEMSMLKLHKAFRSSEGLGNKLIKPVTEEATNLTAGLLTSEGAYNEDRGTFKQWSKIQLAKGPFKTKSISKQVKGEDGKMVWKKIPIIVYDEKNQPVVLSSDLEEYGVQVIGHQITDWGFEKDTVNQIKQKRKANMAIITAKAEAERAKQDAITAEQKGLAAVMKARYEKEVTKEKAVVDASRIAEVAVIKAKQLVDVAEQQKLEAEQKKLAAVEYKQEQILRGEGDGAYKQLVMEADGALAQKLEAYITVNDRYASAIEKQKWVPEIMMGSGNGQSGSAANDLINLLTTKAAKDLSLNMQIAK